MALWIKVPYGYGQPLLEDYGGEGAVLGWDGELKGAWWAQNTGEGEPPPPP